MHVYVWEHIHVVSLPYRTNQWIFTKLGRDEVLMIPYNRDLYIGPCLQVVVFFDQIRPGVDQGWAKIGHGGPFLQRTSSSDRKATATNGMHSDILLACGMKCC